MKTNERGFCWFSDELIGLLRFEILGYFLIFHRLPWGNKVIRKIFVEN